MRWLQEVSHPRQASCRHHWVKIQSFEWKWATCIDQRSVCPLLPSNIPTLSSRFNSLIFEAGPSSNLWLWQIFQGDSCVDKCCRGSKVLKISEESKELECAAGSDDAEWTPENIDTSQLHLSSLNVRSSFFYIKRHKKVLNSSSLSIILWSFTTQVCNIPRPVYQLGDNGRLGVLQQKDNFTQVISSFCIDNLQKEDGGPVAEVIVTDPADCLDVVSFSEDTEEEEDDLKFEKLILIIISPISLFCIAVTGLVYLGKTFLRSPDNQKEKDKIILVNVFFSGLFYTYYVLFQHTNHSTFHVDCSNVVCRYSFLTIDLFSFDFIVCSQTFLSQCHLLSLASPSSGF